MFFDIFFILNLCFFNTEAKDMPDALKRLNK